MNRYFKKTLYITAILAAGFIIGTLLLILANSLPEKNMLTRYKQNCTYFEGKEGWDRLVKGYDITMIDYNTEIHMIKGALTPLPPSGENILEQSLRGYAYNEPGTVHGMKEYHYTADDAEISCDSYERYWHGYEAVLTPLLLCLNYPDIIILNIVFQTVLSLIVLKECSHHLRIAFAVLWVFTMQPVIMLCIDYSVCFYIYMTASLLLLKSPSLRKNYDIFFLIVGIITVYFDFLTWPIITLGIPLVVLLCLNTEKPYKRVLLSSIMWTIGYCGMWLSKWIVGSLLLSDNILKDALRSLRYRSSSNLDGIDFSLGDVFQRNIGILLNPAYLILLISGIIVAIFLGIRKRTHMKRLSVQSALPLLAVSLLPFFWLFATKNHAYEHYWMTWRDFGVSIFAIVCCIGLQGKTSAYP